MASIYLVDTKKNMGSITMTSTDMTSPRTNGHKSQLKEISQPQELITHAFCIRITSTFLEDMMALEDLMTFINSIFKHQSGVK